MFRFFTLSLPLLFSFTALTAQVNKSATANRSVQQSQPVQQSQSVQRTQPVQQARPVVTTQPTQQGPQVRPSVIASPVKLSAPTPALKQQAPPIVIPKVAPVATGTGISGSSSVSSSVIENAVRSVMQDANGVSHLFQGKHDLEELANKLGGEESTVRRVLQEANGKFPEEGAVFKIDAKIEGEIVTVEGKMINGVPRVSTMYVPPIE